MDILRTTKKGTGLRYFISIIIVIFVFLISVHLLNLDFTKFLNRLTNIGEVISRMLVFNASLIPSILLEVLVSICLALTSLVIGTIISFVLAALAADNLAPNHYIACIIKGIVAIIRAIPALVWILMVVASVGFGNTGGMIGLIFPTVGYLTKSFAASSWIAMRFENNIAEGISLGMVGVGGVGYLLNKAIMKFDYPAISTIIVVIFVTMFIFEVMTVNIKKRLHTK